MQILKTYCDLMKSVYKRVYERGGGDFGCSGPKQEHYSHFRRKASFPKGYVDQFPPRVSLTEIAHETFDGLRNDHV